MTYKEGKTLPDIIPQLNVANIIIKHKNNSVYLKEVRYNEEFLYLDGVKYPYNKIRYNVRRNSECSNKCINWFNVYLEVLK